MMKSLNVYFFSIHRLYIHIYFHQTTWEKPPGFVPAPTSPKGKSSSTTSKEKHSRRRKGIMGFLTKITKTNHSSSEKASMKNKPSKIDSNENDKFSAEQTQTANVSELKQSAMTDILRKDFLSVNDDKISASDEESEMSRMSDITDASLFSKYKIKATVGKWAEKVSDKLNSPPDPAYETLNDDRTQPQDTTSVKSGDVAEDSHTNEEPNQLNESENIVNRSAAASSCEVNSINIVQHNQNQSSDSIANSSKDEKPQWRSAIDEATGRTYYFIRGSSRVTWEKPTDF